MIGVNQIINGNVRRVVVEISLSALFGCNNKCKPTKSTNWRWRRREKVRQHHIL